MAKQKHELAGQPGGFTLIELLVVIAIIGILATLSVPMLNDARVRAKETETAANLKQIQVALESFGTDNGGQYPFRMRWFDDATYNAPGFDPYVATDTGTGLTSDAPSYFSLGLFGGVRVVNPDFSSNLGYPEAGRIQRTGMREHVVVQPFGWDEDFYNVFNQYSDPLVAMGYITGYPGNPFLKRPMGNIMYHYGDKNWDNSGPEELDKNIPGENVVPTPGDFVYTHFYRIDNNTNPPSIRDPEGVTEARLSYKAESNTTQHSGMYYLDLVDSYQLWAFGALPTSGTQYVAYPNNGQGLSVTGKESAAKDWDGNGVRDMFEIGVIQYYKASSIGSSQARDSEGNRVEF